MKIAFFRNVQNYEQLCHKTDTFRGIIVECQIIETVELNESDYKAFCCHFLRGYSFLSSYIYKAIVINNIWHGIKVKCGEQSVVVVMNGYQYPRYVGLLNQNPE